MEEEMDTPYGTTRERADAMAAELRAKRIGKAAALTMNGHMMTVTGYVVSQYTGTAFWGITERWRYSDRLDLGEFGGGFVDLRSVPSVLRS
jgi:hypothetical protein